MSHLSEITGLTPIALIFAFALLVLLLIFGLFIFIEFRRIRKILVDVNQRLIVLGQKSEQLSPASDLTKNSRNKMMDDPIQGELSNSNKQLDEAQPTRTIFSAQDKLQRQDGKGLGDKLLRKKMGNTANVENEEFSAPVTGDPELRSVILKLIKAFDMPLSLKHIAEKLSGKYFDGNYHPILNVLEQLEKEGYIEGLSRSGKVYFKKKLL